MLGPVSPSAVSDPRGAVVFDLDGTLVDSEHRYFEAARETLARHGVTGFGWAEHSRFIGIGTRETMEALRAKYRIDADVGELLAEKDRRYLESAAAGTVVFPRMRALVERLHTAGYRLAVASGSSRAVIEAVLTGTGLAALLPVSVSAEEVARGKPAPDVFLEAARRLGAEPAECVVVEDAAPGAEAARRAGMRCIAVPYLPRTADDPGFAGAGLLFPGGQGEFDPDAAYAWIEGGG
ncbi:HAD family hydrolase [Streptomyces palmae]|uniref:HAD family phosphatase n=1 Tax=Streptomyces palmae TaxID=1701085 RepID=A0A4Z0HHW2_9ACTN|nr:HAD family phosphatase [Streptomyces palmae]TGB18263.1 HAD family phosphatase [Streptomyces palmae]